MTRSLATDAARPWHRFWPAHVPRSLDYPRIPIWSILERSATRFPARVAIRELEGEGPEERRTLTYGELWSAVRSVALTLRRRGVAPGARVGFCLPNGADLVIAYHATWTAGAAAVPVNASARDGELESQLADAGVSHLIVRRGSRAEAVAERLGIARIELDALRADEPSGAPRTDAGLAPGWSAETIALLLYTGGTTGTPKGAMLTHANLVANTTQFAEWYAFEPGEARGVDAPEVCVAAIPMSHSGGMAGVMNVPLSAGATMLTFRRFHAGAVARAVTRYRVTRLFGVPTMFMALLNDEAGRRADYGALRACRTNAAPLPASVKAAFDALVGRDVLVEGYGLTETSPLTHANPVGRAKAGSIGLPLPDTDARIVDLETGADVTPGESGELLIRGPQVMRAYWNRPAETADVLQDGWLRTGDVAVMDGEGYFAIVDRKKDLINTAGFKVWPREVEETLYAHPAVKVAAVVGAPDAYRGEIVTAYVVLKDEHVGRVPAAEIVEFCRERLSGYKVPRELTLRAELPMSPAGKLLRRTLREDA